MMKIEINQTEISLMMHLQMCMRIRNYSKTHILSDKKTVIFAWMNKPVMYLEQTHQCMHTHSQHNTHTNIRPTSWQRVLIVLGLRAKITLHQRRRQSVFCSVFQQPIPFYQDKTTQSCYNY